MPNTGKVWKLKDQKFEDLEKQLLYNLGLTKPSEIDLFFNPSLENFSKDIQLSGIITSHKRIQKAIENQETIVVFGDYDVDGISASAVMYKALTSIGAKILPYIPHRDKEGYGLSNTGLEFARDSGATLVITVDNGIVALNQAKFAKEIGLDLIITDHHLPLKILPEASAIVHSTAMCGTAVAWCLIKDLIKKDLSDELLQFVAIATITDLMPLQGINRAFLVEGLKHLNRTRNDGLKALMSESGIIPGKLGSFEIGHILGPRINAIGRLEHAIDGLRLLCTVNPQRARKLAKLLCDTNVRRQELTTVAIEQARIQIGKDSIKKIHVLSSDQWASGVIGLIAGRVCDEYSRPAIVMSIGPNGIAKGSARSANGLNIVEVIRNCSDILIDIGGHSGAAGFSIEEAKIEEFRIRLEKAVEKLPEHQEQILEIDAEIPVKKLTKKLVKDLDKFAPFGFGNPQPLLMSKVMRISDIRTLSEGKHLKFKADGIDAIAFGMGYIANTLSEGALADIAYYLEINEFRGNQTLQLRIKDLKIS